MLNCDSYLNVDDPGRRENADAFAAKLRIGAGNVLAAAAPGATPTTAVYADDAVVIEDSWSFSNGEPGSPTDRCPNSDANRAFRLFERFLRARVYTGAA